MQKTSKTRAFNTVLLLTLGISSFFLIPNNESLELKANALGFLSVYTFLLSVYASPSPRKGAFKLTMPEVYADMKSRKIGRGYIERMCCLLSIVFGIAWLFCLYRIY